MDKAVWDTPESGQEIGITTTGRKSGRPHRREVRFYNLDGRLYILDLAEGLEQWTFDIGKAIVSSPAVVDGTIYVGAGDDRLYAFGTPLDSGSTHAKH